MRPHAARVQGFDSQSEEGQALVLTALLVFVVTLAMFLTFAIGARVREKTRLQAMADASAYSMAVAEARAFNFYAYSNRAPRSGTWWPSSRCTPTSPT